MLFSVITICFNNRIGLAQTRASVASQTGRDFEWLVIDGGSDDGSTDDIARWQNDIAFSCSEQDGGIYDAMNKGLRRARGDYVIFMNAGDVFANDDVLQEIEGIILNNPNADLIYGDTKEQGAHKIYLKRARHHRRWWWGLWTHHQAIFYRRAAIGDLRFDLSHPTNADYKLTLQVMKKSRRIVKTEIVIALCARAGFSSQRPALARAHQRRARFVVMGMSLVPNYTISLAQALSFTLRRNMPQLFARLRFN